jgi:hypothetical protein
LALMDYVTRHRLRQRTRELAHRHGVSITQSPGGVWLLRAPGLRILVRDLADADLENALRDVSTKRRSARNGEDT